MNGGDLNDRSGGASSTGTSNPAHLDHARDRRRSIGDRLAPAPAPPGREPAPDDTEWPPRRGLTGPRAVLPIAVIVLLAALVGFLALSTGAPAEEHSPVVPVVPGGGYSGPGLRAV